MLRVAVVLTITLALLAGCSGKGASAAQMEAQAAEAIAAFRDDVQADGRLESVHVSGWVKVETNANGFPIKVQLSPEADLRLGPAGEVLVEGRIASMRMSAYCDPEYIVTVTENTAEYDIPEGRFESRNPIGHCTGPGTEQLLLQAFEFQLIDPVLLTGQLYVEDMDAVRFSDTGKDKVEAEYTVTGPEGMTTLFIHVEADKVVQVIADNVDSHLVMDMTYGDRTPVEKPEADVRIATPVSGAVSTDDDGWTWRGITREGGPIGDYSLTVYDKDANVGCGNTAASPIVTFDLGGPALQDKSGWRLFVREDGDGKLGMGDELTVSQPSSIVQDFDHVVVIHDDWAGRAASIGCSTPGPGTGIAAIGLIAAVAVLRRRSA